MNNIKHIKFHDIQWPDGFSGPHEYEVDVRTVFLTANDGTQFAGNDLYDILVAYMHDEFNECPVKFTFECQA